MTSTLRRRGRGGGGGGGGKNVMLSDVAGLEGSKYSYFL